MSDSADFVIKDGVLKEYKGKKSPHKLLAVRKVIAFLETKDLR